MSRRAPTFARHCWDLLSHRRVPLIAAIGAVFLMLPALGGGLFMDDLVQRVVQLRPEQLPPEIQQTGFGFPDSGRLGTVLVDLFGLSRRPEASVLAVENLLPWWMPEDVKAALFRPLTAFTHWMDYRLFPNTPWLMHAHNIVWFALAVFLAGMAYRTVEGHSRTLGKGAAAGQTRVASWPGACPAVGLATLLFLLDKNTYFPVMFVANRGFIMALCFGLLCLYAHHRWRRSRSGVHLAAAMLTLGLSLLANEGGVSTLAFLISYALVFEVGGWRCRFASLLPAAGIVAVWRAVYVWFGFGVANLGGYIDPGYEPLLFLRRVLNRVILLWGGQLSGISPEAVLVLSPGWQVAASAVFLAICVAGVLALREVVRADLAARFWFLSMVLAIVPAATVVPLSKNLGFVAVGAFGVIAAFIVRALGERPEPLRRSGARPVLRMIAVLLLVVHIPGALAARAVLAIATPQIEPATRRMCGFPRFPESGGRDVVIVNNPFMLGTFATPFVRAYYSEPVPASVRTLLMANTGFRVKRTSQNILVAQADATTAGGDLMACDELGAAHACYAIQGINDILPARRTFQSGERRLRKGFAAEVTETARDGTLREVTFHFDQDLDSPQMVWLWFDWRSWKYERLAIPHVGESLSIAGPGRASK